MFLIQDNARPHSAGKTIHCFKDLVYELLNNSELAPNNFHLFGPLKEKLRENNFCSDGRHYNKLFSFRKELKIF